MNGMTFEDAKELKNGTILHSMSANNADGTPQRWRVNGKPKTWKTRPTEISIPVKHGLYQYGKITERDLPYFSLTTE